MDYRHSRILDGTQILWARKPKKIDKYNAVMIAEIKRDLSVTVVTGTPHLVWDRYLTLAMQRFKIAKLEDAVMRALRMRTQGRIT